MAAQTYTLSSTQEALFFPSQSGFWDKIVLDVDLLHLIYHSGVDESGVTRTDIVWITDVDDGTGISANLSGTERKFPLQAGKYLLLRPGKTKWWVRSQANAPKLGLWSLGPTFSDY